MRLQKIPIARLESFHSAGNSQPALTRLKWVPIHQNSWSPREGDDTLFGERARPSLASFSQKIFRQKYRLTSYQGRNATTRIDAVTSEAEGGVGQVLPETHVEGFGKHSCPDLVRVCLSTSTHFQAINTLDTVELDVIRLFAVFRLFAGYRNSGGLSPNCSCFSAPLARVPRASFGWFLSAHSTYLPTLSLKVEVIAGDSGAGRKYTRGP